MIAPWMLYSVIVSAVLTCAAAAFEPAPAALKLPRRGVWATAISGSVGVPLLAILGLRPIGPDSRILPAAPAGVIRESMELVAAGASAGAASGLTNLDRLLLGMWVLFTLALLQVFVRRHRALAGMRRTWDVVALDDLGVDRETTDKARGMGADHVCLSDGFGPAVVGLRSPEIVVPRWFLGLSLADRRLIMAHESEHLRSRDLLLLVSGRIAAICLPWLLPLWWQLHRLRLSVELDCDARLLRVGVDPQTYGRLLLEVGRRRGIPQAFAALAEPASHLERRIRTMITPRPRHPWLQVGTALGVAAAFIVVACASPSPTVEDESAAGTPDPEATPIAAEGPAVADAPEFVAYDQPPTLINGAEVRRLLSEKFGPLSEDGDPGGRVLVWMFVDAEGQISRTQVAESSGREQLDQLGQEVASQMRFTPAASNGEKIGVWIRQPIEFLPRGS